MTAAARAPRLADRAHWSNWARNQACAPVDVARPTSEADLVDLVSQAAAAGRRVKAVGAGHSFTSIACTDGTLRVDRAWADHSSTGLLVGVWDQVDRLYASPWVM
jgi:FAD/FMN-containing dehydrogenase